MSGTIQKTLLPPVYHRATPGVTRTVYVPGRPYQPARTVYQYNPNMGKFVLETPGYYRTVTAAEANPDRPAGTVYYIEPTYRFVKTGGYEYVTYPAIPATQGYYVTTTNAGTAAYYTTGGNRIGWNGGARTIELVAKSGIFKFTVAASAAVVGLVNSDDTTAPSEASHAFYVRGGTYTIIEKGVQVFAGGSFAANSEFAIRRSLNKVTYLINDVAVYSSAAPSFGLVYLDATMYLSGDTVTLVSVAVLSPINIAGVSAPAQVKLGKLNRREIYVQALPLTAGIVFKRQIAINCIAEPATAKLSNKEFIEVIGVSAPAQASLRIAAAAINPSFISIFAVSLPLEVSLANGGNTIKIACVAEPLSAHIGQTKFINVQARSLPLDAVMEFGANNEAEFNEFAGVFHSLEAHTVLSVSFSEQFAVLGTISASELVNATFSDGVTASVSATLQGILSAMFNESVAVTAGNSSNAYANGKRTATAWVTNLDTGAVSMYADFDFDRMYELDGKYYGVRDTNTYLLDGSTDNGAPIDAFIAFGKQNFGTSELKHVPNFYAGVSSTGVLLLRVTTGADTYTYAPRRTDAVNKTQRYDLGKGLRANYYEFELFNQAGCDFELDSVEFLALPSGRRI